MHYNTPILLLLFLGAIPLANAADETSNANTLIVPGKSIGGIRLGADAATDKALKLLGKPDGADAAMEEAAEEWYLGAHRGDKGRPFHRPGEIGVHTFTDPDKESPAHPAPEVIVKIYTTSPRFHTAEGIAPGSTLEAIHKKFPRILPDPDGADDDGGSDYWPGDGKMIFYIDVEQGIVFSIRGSDGVCVEIDVVSAGTTETDHYPPMATGDYVISDLDDKIGDDIKLGMTAPKLLALLGKPDEKDETGGDTDGSVWRWRLPAQGKDEPPGLNIYLWKLPDGTLVATQIELTSPAFVRDDTIHPGSPLKDILADSSYISILRSEKDPADKAGNIYGDLVTGVLFDIRAVDSVCTSISIFPSPLDIHSDVNARGEGVTKTPK